MKTRVLFSCLFLVVVTAGSGLAQGVVNFNNNILSSPPDRRIYGVDMVSPLVGTNYVAQLMYGTSPDSLVPHTVTARFRVPSTSQPGTWSGGNRTLIGAGGVGTTIYLQVRVWDSNDGLTFEHAQAVGRFYGFTPVFTYSQVLSSPPAATDTHMHNFIGFVNIPEPAVALLMTPLLVFVLFRGKQRNSKRT